VVGGCRFVVPSGGVEAHGGFHVVPGVEFAAGEPGDRAVRLLHPGDERGGLVDVDHRTGFRA
jgi:hypothetical protein